MSVLRAEGGGPGGERALPHPCSRAAQGVGQRAGLTSDHRASEWFLIQEEEIVFGI